jgi:hypothetical protein
LWHQGRHRNGWHNERRRLTRRSKLCYVSDITVNREKMGQEKEVRSRHIL